MNEFKRVAKELKNKIIKEIFYEKEYTHTTVYVCPNTKRYISPRLYNVKRSRYIQRFGFRCPHCDFRNDYDYPFSVSHYELLHGYVLRPNKFGLVFLFDSILMSGVIYK